MHPGDRLRQVFPARVLPVALLLIVLLCLLLSFWLGRQSVSPARATVSASQVAAERRERAILDDAMQQLQVDNRELLASFAALEDRIALLQRLVAPGAPERGPELIQFELAATAQPERIRYRLLVSDGSRHAPSLGIRLQLSDGQRREALQVAGPRFQFRDYRQFSGDILVPAGMKPTHVDIDIESGRQHLQHRFKWDVKGR